jgi:hypothetical protein
MKCTEEKLTKKKKNFVNNFMYVSNIFFSILFNKRF